MKVYICNIISSVLLIITSLALYYYVFAIADREIIFLYGHLESGPFDSMTEGRYWMFGFVLSGFFSFVYFVLKLGELIFSNENQSDLSLLLMFSALPLLIGIIYITMSYGNPKMPFSTAVSSAFTFLFGIVIGFYFVDELIYDWKESFANIFSAMGLVPFLILFRSVELPVKGILSFEIAAIIVSGTFVFAFIWIILSNRIFNKYELRVIDILNGTFVIAYLGLPVFHFLFFTPKAIPYITTSGNFFPDNYLLRLLNWALIFLIIFLTKRIFLSNPKKQSDV